MNRPDKETLNTEYSVERQGSIYVAIHKKTGIGAQGRTKRAAKKAAARLVKTAQSTSQENCN